MPWEMKLSNFYRDKKLHVSKKRLKLKALEIYQRQRLVNENLAEPDGFTASEGWVSKFLFRNHLTIRRTTTMCQKQPEAYAEKIRRSVNIPDNSLS